MDALRMMGLGAAPLPDSVTNYKIPVPEGPTTTEVPWWERTLATTEKLLDAGKPILDQIFDQLNIGKNGAYNPNLPANTNPSPGGFTPPPAPGFWDKHGTKIMIGGGLALAVGTGIYFATRPKKKK